MPYSAKVLKQLGEPDGLIGRLILKWLNRVNRGMNRLTRRLLDLQEGDRVLEIGFGGGALIAEIQTHDRFSHLVGIDISRLAVVQAEKRFSKAVALGLLEFRQAGQDGLPFPKDSFSKVCCVNVIYFWPDVSAMLSEIYRVLEPGGKLVLSYSEGSPDRQTRFPSKSVETWLSQLGFLHISSTTGKDRENGVYHGTVAIKPQDCPLSRTPPPHQASR